MTKPPHKKRSKKGFVKRAKNAFMAAVMLGSAGALGTAVVKNWMDRAQKEPEPLTETFKKRTEQETLLAKIDSAIERIQNNDTNHADFTLLALDIPNYARNRGYTRDHQFAVDQKSPVVYYITWDLHMLGISKKEPTSKFSNDVADDLRTFQKLYNLPETAQANAATLQKLAEQSYYQRMLVGLYAWKVSLKRGTSVHEKLLVIGAESSGNRFTKADTSSAVGLGQFTDETAIFVIARDGDKMGFKNLQKDARAIMEWQSQKKKDSKTPALSEKLETSRKQILALRTEFEPSIDMMALYGQRMTKGFVAKTVYLYYLLGAGGAQKIIDNPGKKAADLLPAAAEANQDLFYASEMTPVLDKKGKPKKDKKGHIIKEYAALTTEQFQELAAKKVTAPNRVAEALATEGIMRNFVAMLDDPIPKPTAKPAPVAGTTLANQVK